MLIVNGPSRDALGIDYRYGCLGGAGGRGSVTIGRAVALCMRNIGGVRAGETSQSTMGHPARFGMCFGEWEERSAWPSLAQRRGFAKNQDVVSVHASMGTVPICDTVTSDDHDLAYLIAKNMCYPNHNVFVARGPMTVGEVVLVINPVWADRFTKTFPDVRDFQEFVYENAWQPIDLWPKRNQGILRNRDRVDDRGRVRAVKSPDKLIPVVCGGLGGLHMNFLPTWGESEMQSSAIDAWKPIAEAAKPQ